MKSGKFSLLICILYFILTSVIAISSMEWSKNWVLNWDNAGYHSYNPAFCLYNDWHQFSFYETIDSIYKPSGETLKHGLQPNPYNSNLVIKYPCGVAILQLPFFILSNIYCHFDSRFPQDGYSPPYQLSVVLSTLIICFIGILFLRKFLIQYISDQAAAISLLVILVGTNLFYYVSMDQGLSHVYLFSIYSIVLYYTDKWHKTYFNLDLYKLAFLLGFAVLIRPTDILLLLIPICWNFNSREKWKQLFRNWISIFSSLILFLIPISIQLLYWKDVTGHWVYYSYNEEGFNFLDWKIIPAMLDSNRGWLITNPLVILGFIGMAYMMKNKNWNFYRYSFIIYFISSLYILFSWWQWYYGGSYGCRVLIQSLALLALPIGVLIDSILAHRIKWFRYIFFFILLVGIGMNIYASFQYNNGMNAWSKSFLGN